MVIDTPKIAIKQEIERLKLLIPDELQAAIEIESVNIVNPQLIASRSIQNRRCQIQIDLLRWQSLELDVRNLLFWHEVARIHNGSIGSDRSIYMSIVAGLSIASLDLFTQNIGLLTTSLLVAGLAGFRLYQKYIGEENLQRLTAADREAIELAIKFGYERQIARELLKLAIQTTRKAQNRLNRDRSATRLQVLSLS
jgi:Protein of unknown function (DUF3318)